MDKQQERSEKERQGRWTQFFLARFGSAPQVSADSAAAQADRAELMLQERFNADAPEQTPVAA